MPILNYTTSVPVIRTLGELTKLLVAHGASRIATEYVDGLPAGLSFELPTPVGIRAYALPVNVAGVLSALENDDAVAPRYRSHDHARRVAWRIVKDWTAAQIAIVEANLATMDQVMLPYLVIGPGRTAYDAYIENEARAISAA